MRVAFLTSSNLVPGAADLRDDAYEYELEFGTLAPACVRRGVRLEPVVWDQPDVDWGQFDAAVVGTTWDYWDKQDAFVPALRALENAGVRLFNSANVVAWNMDKIYLKTLGELGAPTIPTFWADDAEPYTLELACERLGVDRVVAKPRVSASAVGLVGWGRGEPFPDPASTLQGPYMVQPFLPSLKSFGEVTVMTYRGQISHAVRKVPAAGDFRVQSIYGGREVDYELTDEDERVTRHVLDVLKEALDGEELLYARIDLVTLENGQRVLIEAELIEPYHYPEFAPKSGDMFAGALVDLMTGVVVAG